MRLSVVALLGIEISIIALASAASAATHPDGGPAASSLDESGLHHGPSEAGAAAFMEAFSDAMGPEMTRALEDLLIMEAVRDWPRHDQAWTLEDMRVAQERSERPSAVAEARERTDAAEQRSQALEAHQPSQAHEAHEAHEAQQPSQTRPLQQPSQARATEPKEMRRLKSRKRAKVDLTRVLPRQAAVRMSHITATGWLKSAGLRTSSTGNCTSKHMRHCTSLDKVRTGTIARIIELKRESRCPIMVTGGTEEGHAPGYYSHGNGYKLDITHNSCIDRYIIERHDKAGVRSDGARLYRSGSGTTFADEGDHWDILFR
ncbi:DNA-binding protein [Nonomuraea sp. NPDC049480]|uniref:DNA-binding protein n=1 Tax=Nonomuraea sp. NPDC049480 TaxID=3364353 RepID=UPI0037B102BF